MYVHQSNKLLEFISHHVCIWCSRQMCDAIAVAGNRNWLSGSLWRHLHSVCHPHALINWHSQVLLIQKQWRRKSSTSAEPLKALTAPLSVLFTGGWMKIKPVSAGLFMWGRRVERDFIQALQIRPRKHLALDTMKAPWHIPDTLWHFENRVHYHKIHL